MAVTVASYFLRNSFGVSCDRAIDRHLDSSIDISYNFNGDFDAILNQLDFLDRKQIGSSEDPQYAGDQGYT